MSGDRYYIDDQHATYFLTFPIVDWIDVFTRPDYKEIIVDSLNHCVREKNLECFAWVLMSNHLHLIARTHPPFRLSDVIRDFKKFTSKKIVSVMQEINESRREWMLHKFEFAAHSTGRAKDYKVWQDSNHPVNVEGDRFLERINYIHMNPVVQMIVSQPDEYLFSSACDYAGKKGLVNVTVAG